MRTSGETGSSVSTNHDSLRLFDGFVWRLWDGVGASLSAGVAVGAVFLESVGTGLGFLTV